MAIIDIIILSVVLLGAILGFAKGFIKQFASIVGFVAGLLAARALYAKLAERLSPAIDADVTVLQVVSFIGIWVAVPLLFMLAASLLTKAIEVVSLGWLNRLLGAGLGALKWALLICLLIAVLEYVDAKNTLLDKDTKRESVFYYPMKSFAGMLVPAAKEVTEQYIFI